MMKSAARSTVWAIAICHRPELFARDRGALHWEQDIAVEEWRRLTSVGDEAALQAYMARHA